MMNGEYIPSGQAKQPKVNPYIEQAKKSPKMRFPGTAPFNVDDPAWKEYLKWEQYTHGSGPPDAVKGAEIMQLVGKMRGPGDNGFIGPTRPGPAMPGMEPQLQEQEPQARPTPQSQMSGVLGMLGIPGGEQAQVAPTGPGGAFTPPLPTGPSELDDVLSQMRGTRTQNRLRANWQKPVERKQVKPMGKEAVLSLILGGIASYLAGGSNRAESVNDFMKTFMGVAGQQRGEAQAGFDKDYEAAVNDREDRQRAGERELAALMQEAGLLATKENQSLNRQITQQNADTKEQEAADKKGAKDRELTIKEANAFRAAAQTAINNKDYEGAAKLLEQATALLGNPNIDINAQQAVLEAGEQLRGMKLRNDLVTTQAEKVRKEIQKLGIDIDIKELKRDFDEDTFDDRVAKVKTDAALAAGRLVSVLQKNGKVARGDSGAFGRMYRKAKNFNGSTQELETLYTGGGSIKDLMNIVTKANTRNETNRKLFESLSAIDPSTTANPAAFTAKIRKAEEDMNTSGEIAMDALKALHAKTVPKKKAKPSVVLGASAGTSIGGGKKK